jgi:hypothetical protein
LVGAILHPRGIGASLGESAAMVEGGIHNEAVLERVVLPSARLSAVDRVEIYRQAYRSRLIECLADDYPAVEHALGADAFAAVCRAYIDDHPSRSPSLNGYGRRFADFVASHQHPLAPFAADLAALEWALVEVVHAPSSERLSPDKLATAPPASWAGARFMPSDSVRLLELAYPANAYFQAFRQKEDPLPPEQAWSATAVFRDGPTLWRMDLSRPMHLLLHALFTGRSLGEAIEVLVVEQGACDNEAGDLMQWFRDWVRHGFFSEIIPATP